MDTSTVRGFNYQPGYAWNSYESWRFFDEKAFFEELKRGKLYFPKFNVVRLWLSYDAFRYEEDRQAKNFEKALIICDNLNLKVIPVLFNRWHCSTMDNGGIYYNQMVPGSCWCATDTMYDNYIEKIVKSHANDKRIFAWDTCNEPFSYGSNEKFTSFIKPYEMEWLKKIYTMCKSTGAVQPVAFSQYGWEICDEYSEICDLFFIHVYYYLSDSSLETNDYETLVKILKQTKERAAAYKKQVLVTETCWGSNSDKIRAEIVKRTLSALKECGYGFIAHALNYSHVADLHDAEDGIVGGPGNLCFIDKNGRIRKGHEIFNDF